MNAASLRRQALRALRDALVRQRPGAKIDEKGYVGGWTDNLVARVTRQDFEADLAAGSGNELEAKFRAAHSSSALGVNCFAPFRCQIGDLVIPGVGREFTGLSFERKCPNGLPGGTPPNLDVVLEGDGRAVAIESKLTEYLGTHSTDFSPSYERHIRDGRRESPWFRQMERLIGEPSAYRWLNAAQLVKHAFGLAHAFRGREVTLLYLYWEPVDAGDHAIFSEHRAEIADFAARVQGSAPSLRSLSYPELWAAWRPDAPVWLTDHLRDLDARYSVRLAA